LRRSEGEAEPDTRIDKGVETSATLGIGLRNGGLLTFDLCAAPGTQFLEVLLETGRGLVRWRLRAEPLTIRAASEYGVVRFAARIR
jgi:hypothetical protein